MHEEPRKGNENDVIRAFLESKIDFLVLKRLVNMELNEINKIR